MGCIETVNKVTIFLNDKKIDNLFLKRDGIFKLNFDKFRSKYNLRIVEKCYEINIFDNYKNKDGI